MKKLPKGMDKGAVFVATCIAAAVSTLVMALYANYPIALAPGMGINAFFAFTVVLTYKYTWQQALAAVFCSGVLFFLISVFRIRQYVIDAIPQNLKLAVSAGVGLFLGIIALEEAKVVVAHPATLVTLGDLTNPPAVLMLLGFALIVGLNCRRVLGGTLIGILVVAAIGLPFGLETEWQEAPWMGRFHATKSKVEAYNVNPTIAFELSDIFSIGVGADWQHLKADLGSDVAYGGVAYYGSLQALTAQVSVGVVGRHGLQRPAQRRLVRFVQGEG